MARKDLIIVIAGDNSDLLKKLKQVKRDLSDLGADLTALGQKLTMGLTVPLLAAAGGALKLAGDFEQAQIAFTTMLGSAEKATAFLKDLEEFAKGTPFDFPGLVDASRRLLAMGFEAERVIPILTAVGNAAAATGMGAEGVDRITKALSQMAAKGKVSAEEMTQQLGELIPAWQMLADEIGVSVPEAMKMAEKGMLDGAAAVEALVTAMMRKFPGAMAAQMTSLLGLIDIAKDRALMALKDLGQALLPLAKQVFTNVFVPLVEGFERVVDLFSKLSSSTQTTVFLFAGLAAAMGPVLLVAGAIATAIAGIMVIGAKVAAVIGGFVVVFAAAGAAAILFRDQLAAVWDKAMEFVTSYKPQIVAALNDLLNAAQVVWTGMALAAQLFINGLVQLWNSGIFDGMLAPFKMLAEGVIKSFLLMWNVGGAVIGLLIDKFEQFARFLAIMPGAIGDAAVAFVQAVDSWRAGTDKVGASIEALKNMANGAAGAANTLASGIKTTLPPLGSFKNVIREAGDEAKGAAQKFDDSGIAALAYKSRIEEGAKAFKEWLGEAYEFGKTLKEQKQALDEAVARLVPYNAELLKAVYAMNPLKSGLAGVNVEALKAAASGKEFSEAFNVDVANLEKVKAQITWISEQLQNQNLTLEERAILQNQLNSLTEQYNNTLGIQVEINERAKQMWDQIESAVRSFGSSLYDVMKGAQTLGQSFITMLDDMARAIVERVVQEGIDVLKDSILEAVAATDLLAEGWKKFFGIVGVQSAGNAAGGAAGGAGGAAGGVAGAAGGLTGVISMITGIANLLLGIFQSLQFAAMNRTLDLIEKEVRYSQIHLLNILEAMHTYMGENQWQRHEAIKEFWNEQLAKMDLLIDAVKAIAVNVNVSAVPGAPAPGGAPTVQIMFVDWAEATKGLFVDEIRRLGDGLWYTLDLIRQRLDAIDLNTYRNWFGPELEKQSSILTGIYMQLAAMGGGSPVGEWANATLGGSAATAAPMSFTFNGMRQGEVLERVQREMEAAGIPH